MRILLTVPSPEAVIKNTLDANSEWLQDTNGGGRGVRHRTRNPEKWCVEARRLLGGYEYHGAQNPQGSCFVFCFFLNSWSLLELVDPNAIS